MTNFATIPQKPFTHVLLPYQKRWIADTSQVKVIEKSRRVGISWAEAAGSVLEAANQSGQDTWYIGYNKDMAEEFIRDCASWARDLNLAAVEMGQEVFEDEKNILAFRINFPSGFRVTALSSRPNNLRGKKGRVIIDEAAFHDKLDELLKAALALTMWSKETNVSIISTHDGVDNPFNELVNDIRAGKKPYSLHRVTLEDALQDGLYERICLVNGYDYAPHLEAAWEADLRTRYGDAASEELDCIPSQSGGSYLSRALIELCMSADLPVLRLSYPDTFAQMPDRIRELETLAWCDETLQPLLADLPKASRSYYGMDFARSSDLSVIAPLIEGQGLHRTCPFLIEMRNVPFRQQEQIVFYLADNLPRFSSGAHDSRGNGQYLGEVAMQRYGAGSIHQVMLSQEWYRSNMPKFKAAFEDQEITIPKDADVLDDLRAIQLDKGVPKVPDTKNTGKDGKQRHGDAAIALCLAWFASLNAGGVIEFESIGDAVGTATDGYLARF